MKRHSKHKEGFVYFIENENKSVIKIGFSKDPHRRLKQLQTGNSDKLRLLYCVLGDKTTEYFMQKNFEEHKIRGEWFKKEVVLEWIRRDKITTKTLVELGLKKS